MCCYVILCVVVVEVVVVVVVYSSEVKIYICIYIFRSNVAIFFLFDYEFKIVIPIIFWYQIVANMLYYYYYYYYFFKTQITGITYYHKLINSIIFPSSNNVINLKKRTYVCVFKVCTYVCMYVLSIFKKKITSLLLFWSW